MLTCVIPARHESGLRLKPFGYLGRGAPVDVREETTRAGGVDDAGVPPVVRDPPALRHRVLLPLRLAAPGLIDPEHGYRRQRRPQPLLDMRNVGAVRHWPGDPVVGGAGPQAGEPVGDPAPHSRRSLIVSRARAGTAGSDSVNDSRGQPRSRQRHRRLCQTRRTGAARTGCPEGACSRGP